MICESFGRLIKIRGRNPDGSRYTNTASFKPYFYINVAKDYEGETFTSLKGKRVRKIEFKNTGELIGARNRYNTMYESDVKHIIKYKIDNFKSFKEEPIRTCFLDIETEDRAGFPSIINADTMISSICCYDSFTCKYYVFLTSPTGVQNVYEREYNLDDNVSVTAKIFERETEYEMLMKFVDFVNTMDFDLFYAWNGDFFDYPYIFNRMEQLNISPTTLSPFGKYTKDNDLEKPAGRAFMDLLLAYKKLSVQQIESYSLDYVSELETGMKKVVHSEKIGDMWENNTQKFLKYNIKDVYLMVEIEAKKGITSFFDNIRRVAFCEWYDILYNARVLDCYMLKCAHDWNIILPSRNFNMKDDEPVQGALVGVESSGLHKNVAVVDVKSLYPSIMKTCNMSPETIISSYETQDIEYCKVDDVYFRLDERGFIPRIIEKLWNMRAEYKKQMKKHKYGTEEYKRLDIKQTVAKYVLNSIYGVMKFKSFRLYCRDVFKSVTYFGRKNNKYMQDIIKGAGHELILYDTDSVYFLLNETTYDGMIWEAKNITNMINDWCDQWVIDNFVSNKYNCIEVEFEKIYGTLLTLKNKSGEEIKKNYAGMIIYNDGEDMRDNPSLILVGVSGKRSTTPPLFKRLQKDILTLILTDKIDDAIAKLTQIRKNIIDNNYLPEELALPIGMSKGLYEYDKPSAAIRGAIFANEFCDENIIQEKIKYIYVKNEKYKAEVPRTDVISFTEKFPLWMSVDVDKMAERLIITPYTNILHTMGYHINVLKGQRSLFEW